MNACLVCGSPATQLCHVKDKASFVDGKPHDFHNIIRLCAKHHYHYFDQGKLALSPDCKFILILRCISIRKVERVEPMSLFYVNSDYVSWKNIRTHSYLKAELRKLLIVES